MLFSREKLLEIIASRRPVEERAAVLERIEYLRDDFFDSEGAVEDDDLETEFPEIVENWRKIWAHRHRLVSQEDILQKMNYKMAGNPKWYADNFDIGFRDVLTRALTLPSTTTGVQYRAYFNEEKLCSLRWYFRRDRDSKSCKEIEALWPEECLREVTAEENDARWGHLAGKHAAVRWLGERNREFAEESFPDLDT